MGRVAMVVLGALWLSACSVAKIEPDTAAEVESGFLTDYVGLERGGQGQATFVYRPPALDLSGYDNIRLRGLLLGLSSREIEQRLPLIVDFTELGDYLDMPVRTYSSGMMLRLTFAVATCYEPEVLLMDEWIMAGDAHFMTKARERVETFIQKASILVLASHNLEVCRRWCNKALWLDRGNIRALGPVEDIIAAYQAM